MKKKHLGARPDWEDIAESVGFRFHSMGGEPYWDESSVYEFTLDEVESQIEDPSTELHAMCREAVEVILDSEELMDRLQIPREHWDLVAKSWASGEQELYGRLDMIFSGQGPAKLMEYNADTPTSLYESAAFQWAWLEDMKERGKLDSQTDQFNGVFEALTARFGEMFAPNTDIHFAAFEDNPEDYSTAEMMAWAAREAGMGAHFTDIRHIGLTDAGQFVDSEQRVMGALWKLYPWEDLLRDDFGANIATSGCRFIEPAWKAVVSNKGLMAVLWRMFEGHDNLLPAFFKDEFDAKGDAVIRASDLLSEGIVTKPIFSREGASITIQDKSGVVERSENRAYDDFPLIVQSYQALPIFDGFRPIIGAWVVGETCAGMCIREDRSRITQDTSRFKPHFIRA